MKIIFICGSLEPGQCGVGDYTRRLAGQLIQNGHKTAIIALNDRHISSSNETILKSENAKILSLRLASRETDKIKIEKAKLWVSKTNPDWISLQYVPFSFQDKGLPLTLAKKLKKLGSGRKWHIMFHELWVGMDKKDSLKHKILGSLQKHIIKKTIDVLAPKIMHTHTLLYQAHLNKMGYKLELLALFGNIPNIFQSEENSNGVINIAVFGGIHKGAKLQKWVKELPKSNKYKFHFIGVNGPEQVNWVEILTNNNLDHQLYGWLGVWEISRILSKCQWGLTSTPYYLSEKSGSTAAMLEHNLIVFCIARKWIPRDLTVKNLANEAIVKWKSNLNINSFMSKKRHNYGKNINVIADNFINGLKSNQL